jgi:hypothetical protein
MEKMRLSHQLGYYKLLALGAMLGIAVARGINPKYEEVYILWHFLTAEQQEMSYEFLKFLVARRTTRGEETQINPHRSEVA